MTRPTRYALGLSALLPAVALTLVPRHLDSVLALAARSPTMGTAVTTAMLTVTIGGIVAVLAFAWMAAGATREGLWRAGWVLALACVGAVAAPAFWWLYVRPGQSVSPASAPLPA